MQRVTFLGPESHNATCKNVTKINISLCSHPRFDRLVLIASTIDIVQGDPKDSDLLPCLFPSLPLIPAKSGIVKFC